MFATCKKSHPSARGLLQTENELYICWCECRSGNVQRHLPGVINKFGFAFCICGEYLRNNVQLYSLTPDREAVTELDAKLKEERKQAGEKVF